MHTISSVALQGLKRCHEMVYKADTSAYNFKCSITRSKKMSWNDYIKLTLVHTISSVALQGLKSCHEMVYKADTSTYNFKCSITRSKKMSWNGL